MYDSKSLSSVTAHKGMHSSAVWQLLSCPLVLVERGEASYTTIFHEDAQL